MTISLVVLYLLIIAFLGYLGYRKTHGASDYLVAGRDIHPYIMALSYGATFISTSAIVGFGGAASVFGMGILWLTVLNIFVGIFIAFVFFGKRTRIMGYHLQAHTFPEFLGRRFQSPFMQKFAGMIIFLFMPLYAGVVLIGAAKFIQHQFNIDYTTALFFFTLIIAVYVIMGGLKGVMYTDAFQGTIMFVGMLVLLIYTYYTLGGFIDAHSALTAMPVPPPLAAKGHTGWTSMPSFGSEFWWVLVSTIVMGVGIGVLAQPQLVVRFMTVKSNRELNRAILVGGVFILLMTGVAFISGSLSNVFFSKNVNNIEFCQITGAIMEVCPGKKIVTVSAENLARIRAQHPGAQINDEIDLHQGRPHVPTRNGSISIVAAGGNVATVIPQYIKQSMPKWFGLLFMLTLLAAAMSTLSSQFHAMGTAVGRDFYEQIVKDKTEAEERSVFISKIGIGVTILVSVLLAYILPKVYIRGEAIIARGTAIFFGLCAGSFLPAYLGALYFKKITKAGALAGMIGGFSVASFWLLFVHAAESSVIGLSMALFGRPALFGKTLGIVDPMFIALPVSIILTVAVSLFSQKPDAEHVDKCFKNI
ncbi:MAG TPA: sodium:solute symporter family protein [Spirochaetota bacterium]|nr:sodium:solute symporter family protein [Spirochaetota bacterium]HPQ53584.1 sodium:solute symporter family protein [Spirochaetota bacterium]